MMGGEKVVDGDCEKVAEKIFYAEAIDNFTGQKNGGFLKYLFKIQKKVMTGAQLIHCRKGSPRRCSLRLSSPGVQLILGGALH